MQPSNPTTFPNGYMNTIFPRGAPHSDWSDSGENQNRTGSYRSEKIRIGTGPLPVWNRTRTDPKNQFYFGLVPELTGFK